jgi:hypothetical protein
MPARASLIYHRVASSGSRRAVAGQAGRPHLPREHTDQGIGRAWLSNRRPTPRADQMSAEQTAKPALRGAPIQYADGRTVTPPPLDVDQILAVLEKSDDQARSAFLCVLAHNLTVEIRAILLDRPVSGPDLDRVYQINESLHHLTSCINPRRRRSAGGDVELLRAIVDSSYLYGLEAAVGRAFATAAGNLSREPEMRRSAPEGDLPPHAEVAGW